MGTPPMREKGYLFGECLVYSNWCVSCSYMLFLLPSIYVSVDRLTANDLLMLDYGGLGLTW